MAENDSFIKYSDFIVPDDSIERLIGLLDNVDKQMSVIAQKMPVSAEKMAAAIKKVTGVTTDGQDALADMASYVDRLDKGYRALAFAQSDFGKTLTAIREQIRQTNQETVKQYRDNSTLEGSIDKLNINIKAYMDMLKALSKEERISGNMGADMVKEIRNLTNELNAAQKELKVSIGAVNDYWRAQIALGKAQDVTALSTAKTRDELNRLNKAQRQAAAVANTEESAIDGIKARLDQLVTAYKALSEQQRATPEGEKMLQNILTLTTEYTKLNATLEANTLSSDNYANAARRLALSQDVNAEAVAEMNAQADLNNFKTKAGIQLHTSTLVAIEKLNLARNAESQVLAGLNLQINEQNKLNEINARLVAANIPIETEARKGVDLSKISYEGLAAMYEANALALQKLSLSHKAERDALVAQQKQIATLQAVMQEGIVGGGASLRKLSRNFDGLSFSISQLLREAPAAAVSMNTFFLAISNNIPMVIDQIRAAVKETKLLKAAGQEAESVFKRVGRALLSLNAIMMLAVTLLTFFGDDIVKWIKKVVTANDVTIDYTKALKNLEKQAKKTSENLGNSLTVFYKLQLEWQKLKTTAEKTDWIKNNQSEFSKLGVAINEVIDAEKVFDQETQTVIDAIQRRALALAAEELATEEYKKAMQEGTSRIAIEKDIQATRERLEKDSQISTEPSGGFVSGGATSYYLLQNTEMLNERLNNLVEKRAEYTQAEQGYIQNGMQYLQMGVAYNQQILDMYAEAGLKPAAGLTGGTQYVAKDISKYINNMITSVVKKANDAAAEAMEDGFKQRRAKIEAEAKNRVADLQKILKENNDILNKQGTYKNIDITPEQRAQIEEHNKKIAQAIIDINTGKNQKLLKLQSDYNIQMAALEEERYNYQLKLGNTSAEETLALQKKVLEAQRKAAIETYEKRNKDNRITDEKGNDIGVSLITAEYNKKEADLELSHQKELLDIKLQGINNQLAAVKKGSDDELKLLLAKLEAEKQIALIENRLKPKDQQVDESVILSGYGKATKTTEGEFELERFEEQQSLSRAKFEYDAGKHTAVETARFELEQERDMWDKKVKLAEAGMLNWSKPQIAAAKQTVTNLNKELNKLPKGLNEAIAAIGEYGPGGALLHVMGLDNNQIDAMKSAVETTLGFISDILDAQIEAAEKEIELAQERVNAAKEALDAELEARRNGYANNVQYAQMDLELQKKKEREAVAEKQKAQRAQLALDTITQVSSLVTAAANLWSSLSTIPIAGPILAATAIASMFGSFAIAKVKAYKAVDTQQYGEGGLEFLEGGSHASGNDIDLGVNNHKHKRMHAEGGEALAIINKKRTRQYQDLLPGIIDSLNKGTFEEKYLNTFSIDNNLIPALNVAGTDTRLIENRLSEIINQNNERRYVLANGDIVIEHKNLKQTIKRS